MTHLLLSGRPGAGKTAVSRWLADHRGFGQVETDIEGFDTVNALLAGSRTRQDLGENVLKQHDA
jgi:hypothetical protein